MSRTHPPKWRRRKEDRPKDICAAALKLRAEAKRADRERAGQDWQECEPQLVFTTKLGTPIEPRNFNRAWDARCRRSGVRHHSFLG